jgi:CBS domain-containing protein
MSIKSLCRKEVVTVKPGTMIKDVARIMEEKNLGCVIVSQDGTDWKEMGIRGAKGFGIVTDWDIALKVINHRIDPRHTPIDTIMTKRNLVVLREDMGLCEALDQVRNAAVRRFPVVDAEENLVGIITIDDIIQLMGKEMGDVAQVIENESPLL